MPRRLLGTRVAPLVLSLLGVVSCRAPGAGEQRLKGADGGLASSFVANGAAPLDGAGTIYPRDVPPHPRATRLCQVLHGVAAQRRAACCGGEPSSFLESTCARVVAASLHAKTVELDDAAVDACARAMNEAVTGCGWVTPNAAPAPDVCQRLLRGTLGEGSVCRSSLECRGNLHCEGVSATKTGICTAPGVEGAGCGTHIDVLATYALDRALATTHPFCADFCSLAAHRCEGVPKVGAPCVASVNCAPSQSCIAGHCSAAPPARRGESCVAAPCAGDLRCVDQVCAPKASPGDACSSDWDCSVGGCVRAEDGHGVCAAKCSASLDALHAGASGPSMRLPLVARPSGIER